MGQYSLVILIKRVDIYIRSFTLVPTFFGFVRIDVLLYLFYPQGKSSINLTPGREKPRKQGNIAIRFFFDAIWNFFVSEKYFCV